MTRSRPCGNATATATPTRRPGRDDSGVQGRRLLSHDAAEALGRVRVSTQSSSSTRPSRSRRRVPPRHGCSASSPCTTGSSRSFPEQAQKDVWEGENGLDTLTASSYMPVGKVTRADGGYRLSGKWGFSSGSDHCQWTFLGAYGPKEEGKPPDMFTLLLPRADYELVDDWFVSGLKGTGSKSVVVDDAFVPEHRVHRMSDAYRLQEPGQRAQHEPALSSALRPALHADRSHAGHRDAARRARGLREPQQEPQRAGRTARRPPTTPSTSRPARGRRLPCVRFARCCGTTGTR